MPVSVVPEGDHALQLYLLGGFRVVAGAREIPAGAWGLRRARKLVKLLALAPRHGLHRERVLDLLWPDQELENPDNSLSQALYAARRAMGRGPLDAARALAGLGVSTLACGDFEAARRRPSHSTSASATSVASLQRWLSEIAPQM